MPGSPRYTGHELLGSRLAAGLRAQCPPSDAWAGGQCHSRSKHNSRWPLLSPLSEGNRGTWCWVLLCGLIKWLPRRHLPWRWSSNEVRFIDHHSAGQSVPALKKLQSALLVRWSVRNPPHVCFGKTDYSSTVNVTEPWHVNVLIGFKCQL